MFFIASGIIFVIYDVVLLCISPGTFLDNVTSFTHIWSLIGIYLIFEGIYKKKNGRHFFSTWKKALKKLVVFFLSIAAVVSIVCLFFILTPKTAELSEPADYVVLLGGGIDKNGK